jgi:hypothetical protein
MRYSAISVAEPPRVARRVKVDRQAAAELCFARERLQGCGQAEVLEIDGAQRAHQTAQVGDGLVEQLLDLGQRCRGGMAFEREPREVQALVERDQCLQRIVVQFAGQAPAFFFLPLRDRADVIPQARLRRLDFVGHVHERRLQATDLGDPAHGLFDGGKASPGQTGRAPLDDLQRLHDLARQTTMRSGQRQRQAEHQRAACVVRNNGLSTSSQRSSITSAHPPGLTGL